MTWRAGAAVFGVSFVVAWATCRALVDILQRYGILDVPNERSSHQRTVPRGGGIGVLAGVAAGWLVCRILGLPVLNPVIVSGALLVAVVSASDDCFGKTPVLVRAAVQLGAAGLVVWRLGGVSRLPLPAPMNVLLGSWGIPLAIVWIVGVTNIYNFLDGIDGFAASQGVIAGLAAAAVFSQVVFASTGLSLAGACTGFLLVNWHPARMFLGDVGSATLGFLFSTLPFEGGKEERGRAVFFVAVLLWFFLSDGAFTLVRRVVRGDRIWEAHRGHVYQRLVKAGLGQDRVVLTVMSLSIALAALAVVASRSRAAALDWVLLAASVVGFIIYERFAVRLESRTAGRGRQTESGGG